MARNPQSLHESSLSALSRRQFLTSSGLGLGAMAFSSIAHAGIDAGRGPQHAPRAKKVIYLHMSGAPPQQDMFDHKPKLAELNGSPAPESLFAGKRLAFIKGHPEILGSPHGFHTVGETRQSVSKLLPSFGQIADKVCMLRSVHTDQFNHAPAELKLFTGSPVSGAASMGAWTSWGLGSINANLPSFVVLLSGSSDPTGGKSLWGNGFLPGEHQGVHLASAGGSLLGIDDPPGMDRSVRRRSLDALARLNREEYERSHDPETLARVEQFELAFRMQMAVPEVMDIASESQETQALYGAEIGKRSFANNCLLARRLVERGVRFVQLFDWGWDIHGTSESDDLLTAFPSKCRDIDRAMAALVLDLERRGLLDETLVVWGGEFGRTAMNEARNGSTYLGRDHHPDCFTMWMAGGGVRAGLQYGATDELGVTITKDPISVPDLQATIQHLLGFDPHSLSYFYRGLEQRLIGPDDAPRVHPALFG